MGNKKLQVFVSSTFIDLKAERQAAVEAILSAGHIPAGMELFKAGDETQMTVIKRWIDESDVYLLILGGRYGSVEKTSGKSYTQLEYEYAVEKGKALFAVVIKEEALEIKVRKNGIKMLEQENPKDLKQFREKVQTKLVKFWGDRKDIKLAIYETLNEFRDRSELIGWIKGDNAINTGIVAEQLAILRKENEELKSKQSESTENMSYAGLSFIQLKQLLDKTVDGSTLFNSTIKHGRLLSLGYRDDHHSGISRNTLSELEIYGVVRKQGTPTFTQHKFSEDGHKFYLKSLALRNEENKK